MCNEIKVCDNGIEIIDPKTCVFDISKIQDRMKELGALEDVDCEVIQSINKPDHYEQSKILK